MQADSTTYSRCPGNTAESGSALKSLFFHPRGYIRLELISHGRKL